jgi:hypothetical protein
MQLQPARPLAGSCSSPARRLMQFARSPVHAVRPLAGSCISPARRFMQLAIDVETGIVTKEFFLLYCYDNMIKLYVFEHGRVLLLALKMEQ